MKKIALIALYEKSALGVRSIFSVLKKEGIEASLIFFKEAIINNNKPFKEKELKKLIELLKWLKPEIIGISLRSGYFKTAVNLTSEIRKAGDFLIVWGGIHPTICPEDCLKYADIVCRGEGEYPILELTQGKAKIENFWDKTQQNSIRPLIDLNKLPLPIYDAQNEYLIENETIYQGVAIKGESKYIIMATRGCPFNCSYCGNNSLRKLYAHEKFVRWRSVEAVIEELVQAKKLFKDLRKIFFVDELFVSKMEWLKEFVEKYKMKINLPFEVDLHPNLTSEEMIILLKSAGLTNIVTGIQSGSRDILYNIYKRYTPRESILNLHKILLKHKIKVAYDVILDTPFGGEKETLELLLELKKPFSLHLYSMNYFPKTEMTELLLSKKIIKREDIEDIKAKTVNGYLIKFGHKSWNSLISLSSHRFIPRWFVRFLSLDSIRKHPKPLAVIAVIARFIKIVLVGAGMLWRGEINFLTVKKRVRNIFSANLY